jgi:hypothetical protein
MLPRRSRTVRHVDALTTMNLKRLFIRKKAPEECPLFIIQRFAGGPLR